MLFARASLSTTTNFLNAIFAPNKALIHLETWQEEWRNSAVCIAIFLLGANRGNKEVMVNNKAVVRSPGRGKKVVSIMAGCDCEPQGHKDDTRQSNSVWMLFEAFNGSFRGAAISRTHLWRENKKQGTFEYKYQNFVIVLSKLFDE